jgi:hypothetical protein
MQFDDVKLDPAGFPMVKIGSFYINWLPVTKIQIEYFLSSITDTSYDESWYNSILDQNPRISPGDTRGDNYYKLFATGVIPRDVKRYVTWCGRGFDIPNEEQWRATLNSVNVPASEEVINQVIEQAKGERAQLLLRKLSQIAGDNSTIADHMFLRKGVMEHVYTNGGYGLMGQAASGLVGILSNPSLDKALRNQNEDARLKHIGFRLIKKG